MVLEVESERHIHWMAPTDIDEEGVLRLVTLGNQPHSVGAMAACAGGNVLFVRSDTKVATLRTLMSIDGNDDAAAQEAD